MSQIDESNVRSHASSSNDSLAEKRKSIVFMAAEAVQQERDTIRALKRLSMGGGGSLALDPELSFGIEHELESSVHGDSDDENEAFPQIDRRKRSTSGSSLISETSLDDDEADLTLVDEQKNIDIDNEFKVDAEKLLWVPAKSHPSIAPDQFKRHVQNTLDDMNRKITAKRSYSLPSLKELTDELDKLTEMAGLEANDAITLARSLSSASSSSHLLLSKENILFKQDDEIRRSSSNNSNLSELASDSDLDEDSSLFDSTNSLKRNKWNTYSRRRRVSNKDRPSNRTHSPLSDGNKRIDELTPQPLPKDSKPLPTQKSTPTLQEQLLKQQQRQQAHRSPSLPQHQRFIDGSSSSQLNRSQSDSINPQSSRTNHSRNRHAGSIISIESNNGQQQKSVHTISTDIPEPISKDPTSPISPVSADDKSSKSSSPNASPQKKQQTLLTKKESKSKEFLNLFKMKRSNSPKLKKSNDENLPSIETSPEIDTKDSQFQDFQQEFQQQQSHHQKSSNNTPSPPTNSAYRPNITNGSNFRFSKQTRILQDSVKSLPTKNLRKVSGKNQINNGDIYSNTVKYETSPTSPTFDESQLQFPSQNHLQKEPDQPSPPTSPSSSQHQKLQPDSPISTQRQKEQLQKKLSLESLASASSGQKRPNAPLKFTDSPFGFPLPPLSHSTIIMLDYRFPIHVERAIYRLSHLKLANAKRPLRQQVLLSNFMYAYLNLVNHTLYLQQLEEGQNEEQEIDEHPIKME